MSYIEESLTKGEEIKQEYDQHWVVTVPMWISILLIVPTIGISLLFAIYYWLKVRCTEIGSTNKRIIVKTGIISRVTDEIKLDAIETVELYQSFWGRILGYGIVELTGRGTSSTYLYRVKDPVEVKKHVEMVLEESTSV